MCLGVDMQVVNNNTSADTKLSQNLPRPVPPPIVTAKTNTPVKNLTPIIDHKKLAPQKNTNLKPAVTSATAPQTTTNAFIQQSTKNIAVQKPTNPVVNNLGVPAQSNTHLGQSLPTTNDQKLVPTEQIGSGNRKEEKTNKKGKKHREKSEKKSQKGPGKKGIPTILGILLLIVSLVIGVVFFGNGTGLFAPRATPETTPKNISNSNITNKSFTVSFYTDEETIAFIKYGTSPSDIKQQVTDDRDQLSGIIKPYRLHHITVRGLEPNTNYYYLLGTGSNTTFDNAGNPYQIKTASDPGRVSPNNQTIYGMVSQANGQPGEGAIVFVTLEGAGALSTLVKSSGSWAVSLANAFNLSLNDYPEVAEDSPLTVKVQGIEPNSITSRVSSVANAQPVPEIIMGQEVSPEEDDLSATREELLGKSDQEPENISKNTQQIELEDNLIENSLLAQESTESSKIGESLEGQDSVSISELRDEERTLDLSSVSEEDDIVVNSTQPIIKNNLLPNVTVKIEVHSDTAIETVGETDANGELVLDIASLEQSLGPGDHTVTYTYIDPNTGEEVIQSYDFTVSADDAQEVAEETRTIASAETESLPYGSGNPYVPTSTLNPSVTPTPVSTSVTPTITPAATESARETVVSTESGTYNAGSIFNTLGLLVVGLFFLATGVWSFLLAKQFKNH